MPPPPQRLVAPVPWNLTPAYFQGNQQPLSFETDAERLPSLMDAKKGKTRKESTPIKVWVTPEEKAAIAAKANAHSLSAAGANKLKVAQREFYSRLNCQAVRTTA